MTSPRTRRATLQLTSPERTAPRRRDRLIREREHDTYKAREKLSDPTSCTDCGAVYRQGRWAWGSAPGDAQHVVCPACQRTRDRYPSAYLTLSGEFLRGHRDEILGLARNVEAREKEDHPLTRIMDVSDKPGATVITTTSPQLARSIGEALHAAYGGDLDYRYADPLRVSWKRESGS